MVKERETSSTCTMKGYKPPYCTMTAAECKRQCPGGGGEVPEPEGCKDPMPQTKKSEYGWWQCIGRAWEWMHGDPPPPPPPVDFCKKFPEHEKCRPEPKPKPDGNIDEQLAVLEKTISTLDDQIEELKGQYAEAKDAVAGKNDEVRALKKSKAPREEIKAAEKELKSLKRTVSAMKSKGKKLTRELQFTERKYENLRRLQMRAY